VAGPAFVPYVLEKGEDKCSPGGDPHGKDPVRGEPLGKQELIRGNSVLNGSWKGMFRSKPVTHREDRGVCSPGKPDAEPEMVFRSAEGEPATVEEEDHPVQRGVWQGDPEAGKGVRDMDIHSRMVSLVDYIGLHLPVEGGKFFPENGNRDRRIGSVVPYEREKVFGRFLNHYLCFRDGR